MLRSITLVSMERWFSTRECKRRGDKAIGGNTLGFYNCNLEGYFGGTNSLPQLILYSDWYYLLCDFNSFAAVINDVLDIYYHRFVLNGLICKTRY